MNRNQRRAAAKVGKTASGGPAASPAVLCEFGFTLLRAGQVAEAENCGRQALDHQPNFADALHLMGNIAFSRKQFGPASEYLAAAIRQTPKPEYLFSLGRALELLERLEEALKAYQQGVSLKPEDAEIWKSIGFVLTKLDRTSEAIAAFRQVLRLSPRHKEAANMCATLLSEAKRYQEALVCYDLSAELEPNSAWIYQGRGTCHSALRWFEPAIADYERALRLAPDHAETHYNLGHAHLKCGQYETAAACFERALTLNPKLVPCLINNGLAAIELRKLAEAFDSYNKALAREPENAQAQWNRSLLNMLTGNFAAGWAGWEARWQAGLNLVDRHFSQPLWLGRDSIAGKTILLHADEGIGDAIQYARYVPMVAALGARVFLEAHEPIAPLLSGISGVTVSAARGVPLPQFDFHCPLGSLPLAFETGLETIPPPVSCLSSVPGALRQQWESWLGPRERPRVGLVWSGDAAHANDGNRSTSLRALFPILDLDVTFVSLQKDPRQQDRIALGERTDIMDASARLTDFLAAAALVSCLDLVITVDTSVAHLAGTLGCPVWIMLPYTPDWRWMLDRDDSPWYPAARLFRQDAARDYAPVVERIRGELQDFIAGWPERGRGADLGSATPLGSLPWKRTFADS